MALDDNALFTAASGYVFVGTVGVAVKPTAAQISAFTGTTLGPTGWTDLGHTSREDLPEFGFEGGDAETRGTWRNAALREVITEAAVDFVDIRLHQFDDQSLALYYGAENASVLAGEFAVAETATATVERAITMVIVDGDIKIALYAPKVSVRRTDSIEMAVDGFSVLPIRCTFLKHSTNNLFTWINEDILNPDESS